MDVDVFLIVSDIVLCVVCVFDLAVSYMLIERINRIYEDFELKEVQKNEYKGLQS